MWFKRDKPGSEGSEKKKATGTETLIFSEKTAAGQKVPEPQAFSVDEETDTFDYFCFILI